eukprot:CAMPEP_0196655918 /NCGR_PEP_ID=MMETSP1086-20130531/11246_1 /TAXON_ID=77921 /ORGANISM="Cyanoptyche  gloeocystis , Strain SAG4.97" /LENGTH=119 /DNA_ID=CAMNT_0041988463 /DNA_START=107 /DNA_END=465 /DNA_ORIENTATION=-
MDDQEKGFRIPGTIQDPSDPVMGRAEKEAARYPGSSTATTGGLVDTMKAKVGDTMKSLGERMQASGEELRGEPQYSGEYARTYTDKGSATEGHARDPLLQKPFLIGDGDLGIWSERPSA